ncbi:MAG TPA: hypothetical protein VGL44_05740 [Gaiellales bacterium]|jgi:hypothetical protein
MGETNDRAWHVGDYGPLGWAETAIKAAAFVCAYVAFAHALDRTLHAPDGIRIAELALLGVAEVGLAVAIADRLIEREAVALGFVGFNNAAHLGMLYALVAVSGPGGLVSLFCGLMLTGELVKIVWLRTTEFTVREVAPLVVQGLVLGYAVIYAVALVVWQFVK